MAIKKRYELISEDSERKVWLALEDYRAQREDRTSAIELTLTDDSITGAAADEGFETMSVWLTTEEAHELRSVLAVLLGVATREDVVVAEGPHVIS